MGMRGPRRALEFIKGDSLGSLYSHPWLRQEKPVISEDTKNAQVP